mmetsp:Transcript_121349/g.241731  ORF Transcript_121349/g.241731 Transcript_121349/m.241731 type:complete len:141 (-) Transcript_121349:332-754(-)
MFAQPFGRLICTSTAKLSAVDLETGLIKEPSISRSYSIILQRSFGQHYYSSRRLFTRSILMQSAPFRSTSVALSTTNQACKCFALSPHQAFPAASPLCIVSYRTLCQDYQGPPAAISNRFCVEAKLLHRDRAPVSQAPHL